VSEATDLQKMKDDFRKTLISAKAMSESYVVLSIYKASELMGDTNLTVDDFDNMEWKFFFSVAKDLVKAEKKVLDDIVVGLRVAENENLQKMYDEYGGWDTLRQGMSFVKEDNFDGYVRDLKKANALIKLHDLDFPIMQNFENYKMQTVESLQQKLEETLASVFADVDIVEKVEDMSKGLWNVVMDAHEGKMRGFPYKSALLNEYVNGQALGNLTMLSANSGMGKTFLALAQILPNMIEFGESLMILANEEDIVKWKREIITWSVNNMTDGSFEKQRFNQGNFTQDELDTLKAGVDWLDEMMEEGKIRFINFNSFSMKKAIKMIKKESTFNDVKYFILDTLKLDSDAINENVQAWLQLQVNMVHLYDLIKPSNRNLHVFVTYQLGKSAMLTRYLSQNSLGMSKNVVDTVSTLMLVRRALESEKAGGKNEVTVKTTDGKEIKMEKGKEYFIMFLGKNRMGATHRQLVFEIDMGRNIVKDYGTCLIEQDI
jgi:replicative DNA helicase